MDPPAAAAERARLLGELERLRRRSSTRKRRTRVVELVAGWTLAIAAALGFRVLTTGGIAMRVLGPGGWLLTAAVGLFAFVGARAVVATVATRWLLPARRDVAAAESRLRAHDAAWGRPGRT